MCDLLKKIMVNKTGEGIGLAFDGSAAAQATTPGFEFRFYRGDDTRRLAHRGLRRRGFHDLQHPSGHPTHLGRATVRATIGRAAIARNRLPLGPGLPRALRVKRGTAAGRPRLGQACPLFDPPFSWAADVRHGRQNRFDSPGQGRASLRSASTWWRCSIWPTGSYYAIDDLCPHMGASLAAGDLGGGRGHLSLARLAVSRDRRHLVRQSANQNPRVRSAGRGG